MTVSHCANIHGSLPAALRDKRRLRFSRARGGGLALESGAPGRIQPLSQRGDIGPLPFMHIPHPTFNG